MQKPPIALTPVALAVLIAASLAACSSGNDSSGNDAAGGEHNEAQSSPPAEIMSDDTDRGAGSDAVAAPGAASAAEPAAVVPAAFGQCRSCHAVEPGQNRIGPSLADVFGAKAGHVESYTYSAGLKDSGLIWDETTLDAFLKSPREEVAGTKMTFPGVKNDAARAEVISYLKTL